MDLNEDINRRVDWTIWHLLRLVEGATGGLLDVSTTGLSGKVPGSSEGASGASEDDVPWFC